MIPDEVLDVWLKTSEDDGRLNSRYTVPQLIAEIRALRKIRDAAQELMEQPGYPDCWDFGMLDKALADYMGIGAGK